MNKEHYVIPERFEEMEREDKIFVIRYTEVNSNIEISKIIIDSIREINKGDPGFVYTCICDENKTEWSFGYTDFHVYRKADSAMDLAIIRWRERMGIFDTNVDAYFDTSQMSACVCPFDL